MPAEPTSEWGKELKAAVGQLQDSVSDGLRTLNDKMDAAQRDIGDVNKRIADPNVGIYKLIGDTKKEIGDTKNEIVTRLGGIEADAKLIPGVKLMLGILGPIIVLLVGSNGVYTYQNTMSLSSVNGKLGEFKADIDKAGAAADSAKKAADTVAAETRRLTTAIDSVKTSFDGMDQKLDQRFQQFDERLSTLGQKIADLDKASATKQQLDNIQAKVNTVEGKLDGLGPAIGGPSRRTVRVTEFRSLSQKDRSADARLPGIAFGLNVPEPIETGLVEEVSAIFPAATIKRLGATVMVVTRLDAKARLLFISLVGAPNDTVERLLTEADGLHVSITYISREP